MKSTFQGQERGSLFGLDSLAQNYDKLRITKGGDALYRFLDWTGRCTLIEVVETRQFEGMDRLAHPQRCSIFTIEQKEVIEYLRSSFAIRRRTKSTLTSQNAMHMIDFRWRKLPELDLNFCAFTYANEHYL